MNFRDKGKPNGLLRSAQKGDFMRITCPECGTVYEVEDKLVPSAGVNVKCVNCHNTFFVKKEKPSAEEISLVEISAQPVAPAVEEASERAASAGAGALAEEPGVSAKDKWAPAEPSESGEAGGSDSDKTVHEKSAGDGDIAVEKPAPDMAEYFGDVPLDIGDSFDDFSFDGTEDSDMARDLMELQLGADMIDYSIIDKDIDALLDDSLEIGEGVIAGLAAETIPEPPGRMPQEDDNNTVLIDLESVVGKSSQEAVTEEPDPDENLSGGQFDISGILDGKAEAGGRDELIDLESVVGKSAQEAVTEEPDPDENLSGGQFDISGILDKKAEAGGRDELIDLESVVGKSAQEAVTEEPDPDENLSGGQFDISGILDEKAEAGGRDELIDIESVVGKSAEEAVGEEASDKEPTGDQFDINDITLEEAPEEEFIQIEPEEILLEETETDAGPLEIGEVLPDAEETVKETEKPREEAVEEIVPEVAELSLEELSIETEVAGEVAIPEPAIEEESGSGEGEPSEIGLELSEDGDEPPSDETPAEEAAEEPAVESGEEAGEESGSGESAIGLAEPEPAGVETEQPSAAEESLFEATAESAEAFAGEEGLDELIHEETEAEVNYVSSVTAKPTLLSRFTAVDILVAVAAVTVAVAALAFLLEKIGLLRAV